MRWTGFVIRCWDAWVTGAGSALQALPSEDLLPSLSRWAEDLCVWQDCILALSPRLLICQC